MYNTREDLESKVSHEWHRFYESDTCDTTLIRPVIYNSWVRSKLYGVDPNKLKGKILSEEELQRRIDNKENLVKISASYINNIYSFVKNSGFAVYLTDEEGYILYLVGDDEIIETSKNFSRLCVGANRSEKYSGTNAIGTCLAIDKPVQVFGSEHYVIYHRKYTCSAAPIHDENNNIIGCLDITGTKENVHSHTLGMVVAAVDGIEKELKINNAYNKIHSINSQLSTTLNSIDSAIVVVSSNGIILNINKVALTIFNLSLISCINRKINEVLEYDTKLINFENLNKKYNDIELEIQNKKFNITISSYNNKFEQTEGSVITFKEMKKIHKMVNKYSGFTATYTIDNIIGQSAQISYVKNLCLKASKSSSNVLILGESGTGKELVAQSIHNASTRAKEPFIAINCGALPKGLIESELFGYEGGSFTGASKEGKPGKFELADGGTIFLDEIGDMPLDTQVSLLRVLQDKEIVRIGGSKPKPIDIRVIAATNKNLYERMHGNSFRDDLYYRLNVLTITVPPLRERMNDIKVLLYHFLNHYNNALNKNVNNFDNEAMLALTKYSWPGNIRELENVLERAINIVDSNTITLKDLPPNIQNLYLKHKNGINDIVPDYKSKTEEDSKIDTYDLSIRKTDLEKEEISEILLLNGGNVVKSAEFLGISRRTLYRKLQKYNITVEDFR